MLSYLFYKIAKADLASFEIPDEYTAFIAAAGLALTLRQCAVQGGLSLLLQRIIIAEAMLLISGLIMGFGDAKLFAALSLLFGARVVFVFVCSLFAAGIYCAVRVARRKLKMTDHIAFAPFISVCAMAVYFELLITPSCDLL